MTNGIDNTFNYAGFAATILRVMGIMALLFTALMFFAVPYVAKTYGKEPDIDPFFAIPIFLYLAFIFGWGIAYNKFFRFPANQRVLLSGVGIGSLIVPVLGGIAPMLSGQMTFSDWLAAVPQYLVGSLLGAAMQLYFLVIVLRYVFRFRFPF